MGSGIAQAAGGSTATINVINQLAEADPSDVQQIAASEIRLLTSYYDAVLSQAGVSFSVGASSRWYRLGFFHGGSRVPVGCPGLAHRHDQRNWGAVVEVIAGINFVLYGRTTAQLADFHHRLDRTQRFLLANSICECPTLGE